MTSARKWVHRIGEWMRGASGSSSLPTRMFWVGLVARVLYMTLAHTFRIRLIIDHFQFGWEMGRIARALATGYGFADPFGGHSGPTAWTPPLYPLLLAGVFKIFGVYTLKSAWVILAINSVFSAATAPAVYEIAWRCFGRDSRGWKVALWSGWLWALYPAAMQYAVHWIWDMALTACLFSWAIVLALRIRGVGEEKSDTPATQSALRWVVFGTLWGLIALSNSSLITFLPACGIWMIWGVARRHLALAMRNAILGALCCTAVVSPWIVRNWLVFHAFIPMRSNFGAEFYQSVQISNQGFPWGPTLPLADKDPGFQQYKQMGEIAYSRQQGERAWPAFRTHRNLLLRYTLKRVYFFWFSVPHPIDNKPAIEAVRELNFSFLSVGGVLGLALALKRRIPGAWLFFWAFTIIPLIYYVITVQARFRHPLEPLITVLIVYLFQSATPRHAAGTLATAEAAA